MDDHDDIHDEEQASGEFEFLGRRPHITINGGVGGAGGGGIFGGMGGRGDGPQFHIPSAPGWNVHVNGNFITRTNAPHSDYRRIPMGDIILQSEIHINHSNVFWLGRRGVRKLYSAKLDGKASRYTVAMYEGKGSEEEWKRDIAKYMSIRHPNILQIFAMAHSHPSSAAVFHSDSDLIDFKKFFQSVYYHKSQMLFTYLYASAVTAYYSAERYLKAHGLTRNTNDSLGILLIHRSKGRLCIDISSPHQCLQNTIGELEVVSLQEDVLSLSPVLQQQVICKALSLKNYNFQYCNYWSGSSTFNLGTRQKAYLGVIVFCPPNSDRRLLYPLAFASKLHWHTSHRQNEGWKLNEHEDAYVHNGWVRIPSQDYQFEHKIYINADDDVWLSQANHIFKKAGVTANLGQYCMVDVIWFIIKLVGNHETTPKGYLWICPVENFQRAPLSFGWPECPAFWSLDSSGSQRLNMDQALQLGFPTVKFSTTIRGLFRNHRVYAGLREFHEAKGFDPYSQEIALHLGDPLYQLWSEPAAPFAYLPHGYFPDSTSGDETDSDIQI
ncbi:hypothetical protein R3P38DRAFT_1961090 [Favolaschia claudopus]|uniref:Protein kinase domain-containing protein n=1 Tax=Favolaschia claudopus TaxID=2862362 RepID=A0AAV9ZYQ5_9AGAR